MTDTLSRPLAERVSQLKAVSAPAEQKPIPSGAVAGAIQALADGKTHYTTRPGIVPLREKVSEQLKHDYQLDIAVDDITITCGIQEAEFVALKKLATPSSQVLYTDNEDGSVADYLQGFVPLLEFSLTDTPNNPDKINVLYIGASSPNLADWLQMALTHNWWIIWNTRLYDASSMISQDENLASRTVLTGTFEDQLPGWAVGWMAGSEMAGQLRSYKQSMTICSPSISQWAAYGMVNNHAE
ncbi:MAG: hypothetical protein WBC91_12645 [Phototrophicaceae bacterium]